MATNDYTQFYDGFNGKFYPRNKQEEDDFYITFKSSYGKTSLIRKSSLQKVFYRMSHFIKAEEIEQAISDYVTGKETIFNKLDNKIIEIRNKEREFKEREEQWEKEINRYIDKIKRYELQLSIQNVKNLSPVEVDQQDVDEWPEEHIIDTGGELAGGGAGGGGGRCMTNFYDGPVGVQGQAGPIETENHDYNSDAPSVVSLTVPTQDTQPEAEWTGISDWDEAWDFSIVIEPRTYVDLHT